MKGSDLNPIFIGGDNSVSSTLSPSEDYDDEETVDGSEKQDVMLQNGDEATSFPMQEALDGNSANIVSCTNVLVSVIFVTLQFLRIRFLWLLFTNCYFWGIFVPCFILCHEKKNQLEIWGKRERAFSNKR